MEVRVELELTLKIPAGQDVRHAVEAYLKYHENEPAGQLLKWMTITEVTPLDPWQTGHGWDETVWGGGNPDE